MNQENCLSSSNQTIQGGEETMKNSKVCPFILSALFIALIAFISNAHADPSGGETAAVSVASVVHGAADAAALSEEFDAVMDQYDKEVSAGRKKELLEKAKNIMAKLIEQANNVESEISILSKKKLDKVYLKKLDRVLSSGLRMREAAKKRLQVAVQAG